MIIVKVWTKRKTTAHGSGMDFYVQTSKKGKRAFTIPKYTKQWILGRQINGFLDVAHKWLLNLHEQFLWETSIRSSHRLTLDLWLVKDMPIILCPGTENPTTSNFLEDTTIKTIILKLELLELFYCWSSFGDFTSESGTSLFCHYSLGLSWLQEECFY